MYLDKTTRKELTKSAAGWALMQSVDNMTVRRIKQRREWITFHMVMFLLVALIVFAIGYFCGLPVPR